MRECIIAVVLMLSIVFAASLHAENASISSFVGLWNVHVAKTLEEGKKSPKYVESDAKKMAEFIKRQFAIMKLKLFETEMTYIRNGKERAFPFTVKETGPNTVTLLVKMGKNEATVVLSMREGTLLNFTSSLTDDMNFYIWEKSE